MKKNLLFLVFLFMQYVVTAQREYGICDSTTYVLNNDTSVVAGRTQLYLYTNNTLMPLFDFTTSDTNQYIRDFDIVKPDLWYTIIGSRYIGSPTQLYKSQNRGLTWSIDTNHFQASNSQLNSSQFLRSINNLQHLNGDTLMMFMHYYEAGILYSTDLGQTWTKWFDNLISHYQGMFSCNNKYYIYGFEGDAFRAWMFGFDRHLLFSSDSAGLWNSFNSMGNHPPCSTVNDTVNCIYANPNISRCATYNFFKQRIDSLCSPLSTINYDQSFVKVYPNPTNGMLHIVLLAYTAATIVLYNSTGTKVKTFELSSSSNRVDVSAFSKGLYYYQIIHDGKIYIKNKIWVN